MLEQGNATVTASRAYQLRYARALEMAGARLVFRNGSDGCFIVTSEAGRGEYITYSQRVTDGQPQCTCP
jgi:hypothetical protein